MALEIITPEDLEQFRIKLLEDIRSIVSSLAGSHKEWLKSHEVRELLGISPETLQQFRINGNLAYSKVGV